MTMQVREFVRDLGRDGELCRRGGDGLLTPADLGIRTLIISTAEHYTRDFEVADGRLWLTRLRVLAANGRYPTLGGVDAVPEDGARVYRDLRLPLDFTGGLLLGHGLLGAPFEVCFELPTLFAEVHELLFERGRLQERVDHSATLRGVRERLGAIVLPGAYDIPWPFRVDYGR